MLVHRPALYAFSRVAWQHHSSSCMKMKFPFLFTVAALTSLRSTTPVTFAEQAPEDNNDCPFYGCPLYPADVHYNTEEWKKAFQEMRSRKRIQGNYSPILDKAGREDAATFTLIGYKGGQLDEQINQDRAIVVAPYYVRDKENRSPSESSTRILMGVFDGHAPNGEAVSEYTAQELPKLLASKLEEAEGKDETTEINLTKKALHETFVQLDRFVPAHESGGCTASVLLLQSGKVYVANAGDSRTFLVAYRPSTDQAEVLFISREDKPDLPEERERVENMGGQVYIPVRGTSRVVYHDPRTGAPTGLAMSRSIGDWAAGKLGVVPDPKIDVFDLQTLVDAELYGSAQNSESFVVSADGDVSSGNEAASSKDDVYIFAVSATDGLMDFLEAEEIARVMALSLCHEDGAHPVTACEQLIFAAANGWQQSKQGRYRDDIAIAVATLRVPPKVP